MTDYKTRNNTELHLRIAVETDIPELHSVFEASVRNTCNQHYNAKQLEAWVGRATPNRWRELYESELCFFIAESMDKKEIAGFASINNKGYLHSMFVHPKYQHCGIAHTLLQTAENFAKQHQASSIFAEVSLTARAFFEQQGYIIEKEQTVSINQEELTNFVMRKI